MARKVESETKAATPVRISKTEFLKLLKSHKADKETMGTVRGEMGSRIAQAVRDGNLHKRAFNNVVYFVDRSPAEATAFLLALYDYWEFAGLPTEEFEFEAPIPAKKKPGRPKKVKAKQEDPWEEERPAEEPVH